MKARSLSRLLPQVKFTNELILRAALVASLAFSFGRALLASDITWIGGVSTDWNNPVNWSPQRVPTASDHVIINSGDVTVPASATFSNVDWTGGNIYGALTVASNRVLNVGGNQVKFLYGPLTNYGTVRWSGGVWYVQNDKLAAAGAIYNQPEALFDMAGDLVIGYFSFNNTEARYGFFANSGLLRKSDGGGFSAFFVGLTNSGAVELDSGNIETETFSSTGTVDVNAGMLEVAGGGVLGGNYSVAAGSSLDLSGGDFIESGFPAVSGAGQAQITSGSLTLTTDLIPGLTLAGGNLFLTDTFQDGSITNLTLSGINLMSSNIVTGTLNWSSGDISGTLAVASNGVLNVTTAATKHLLQPLIDAGRFNWINGGRIYGDLTVATSGVLSVSGNALAELSGSLTNEGTIIWAGAGDWWISESFCNLIGGLFEIRNDRFLFPAEKILNAGTVRKSASSGRTLIGGHFNNSGIVEAETGTISFSSFDTNAPSASLAVSLGGTTVGSGYGHVHFANPSGNPVTLAGTFSVSTRDGFRPNPGDTFHVLSYPSTTNSFTCLSGLDLGGGLMLQPQFDATSLTLIAIAYATNSSLPQLFISPAPGGLLVTWPTGYPDWTLLSTTNLASAFWSPVPNPCGNQAVVPIVAPGQYFRLRNNN